MSIDIMCIVCWFAAVHRDNTKPIIENLRKIFLTVDYFVSVRRATVKTQNKLTIYYFNDSEDLRRNILFLALPKVSKLYYNIVLSSFATGLKVKKKKRKETKRVLMFVNFTNYTI